MKGKSFSSVVLSNRDYCNDIFSTDDIILAALRQEIGHVCTAVPLNTLANVAQAVYNRTNKCLEAKDRILNISCDCRVKDVTCIDLIISE